VKVTVVLRADEVLAAAVTLTLLEPEEPLLFPRVTQESAAEAVQEQFTAVTVMVVKPPSASKEAEVEESVRLGAAAWVTVT